MRTPIFEQAFSKYPDTVADMLKVAQTAGVALCGVVTRHRYYINTKDLAKVTMLQPQDVLDFQAAFKKCCDQTDVHDPSRGRNAARGRAMSGIPADA